MRFFQLDVFADASYRGNPLAVFPDAPDLSRDQMQSIASEMNLSETTFVTRSKGDTYDVRIFTPHEELPFAGHPTLGTAWLLRRIGALAGDAVVQRSAAGDTTVSFEGDWVWFERKGRVSPNLADADPGSTTALARALDLEARDVGLEAREIGRSGLLLPAYSDAGYEQLMVPLRDLATLERTRPRADLLIEVAGDGAYCFTAVGAGRVRARGFFPGVGAAEDPATGSAAAALGLYLADRTGAIDFEIEQGVEMKRPSRIGVRAGAGSVRIGGRCKPVFEGTLETLP